MADLDKLSNAALITNLKSNPDDVYSLIELSERMKADKLSFNERNELFYISLFIAYGVKRGKFK